MTRNPSRYFMVPTSGCNVVKGYGAISGRAMLIDANKLDLPAFGKPTNPMSAINFSSNSKYAVSPGFPTRRSPAFAIRPGVHCFLA
mmetsp:Transcript_30687/g.71906  ORF Transcript_30687/g.71906 Transcript_30687/m.71906 type:complete len:86 (-) Transcript_30687:278-535(-)